MVKIKLWNIFKIFLIVFVGYFLALVVFCFCQGPDGAYDLGDGYQLNGWPGRLLDYTYWWSFEYRNQAVTLEDRVTAYYVRTPWVVGKTEKDKWFVIQKEKHEIHYPIEKPEEAGKIAGLVIKESDMITDPVSFWFPRHEVVQPHTKRAVIIFSVIYIAAVLVIYKIKRGRKGS